MRTAYTHKTRIISMLLCVMLVLGLISPTGVRAAQVSKIYTAEELATNGISLVPGDLTSNAGFMGDYVNRGGRMSLNGSFSRYSSDNADGAGDKLPTGIIKGNSSDKWYASYMWAPSQAQRDVINRDDVKLYFSANMIPDHHKHNYVFKTTEHWSLSAIRLTRGNGSGGNTWTYGNSDYGWKKNGDIIVSYGSAAQGDDQAQPVGECWEDYPAGDKELFYNAYHVTGVVCGNPKTSGALFYAVEDKNPTISAVEFGGGTYTAIPKGGLTETVTIRFSEKIRFADNAAHEDIKLKLDAEYLEQSGKNGGFSITADFVEMGYDYLKFQFRVEESWKHIKVNGLSADQPDLMNKTALRIFDGSGNDVGVRNLETSSVITDLAGNSLVYSRKTFSQYYDGVAPVLKSIEMKGPDISDISRAYDSWTDNSGTRRFIYAGAGDRITFQAVFNESVNIRDTSTAKAVLSIRDENGSYITLPYKSHSGNTVTFQELNVTETMKNAGDRIYILRIEGMDVTDYAGNALATNLTGGLMLPAQDITLDVDKPEVSSTIPDNYIVSSDPLVYQPYADVAGGEYFSFPVSFQDFNNGGADRSGVAGADMKFSLDMVDGGSYSYWWAMDTNQNVSGNTQWKNGTTGQPNTFPDLAEDLQYWVHIQLDPNIDYNYSANLSKETVGVYFNGILNFGGVSDWAGNLADEGIHYTLRHQVDNQNPTYWSDTVKLTPDYDNGKVTFSTRILGRDVYGIRKISYRWQIKPWGRPESEYEYINGGEWTEITPDELGLNKEFWVEPSFTYDYTAEGAFRSGQVRVEAMVEDLAGNMAGGTSYIFKGRTGSFDYSLASSRSSVINNKPSEPAAVPQVTMREPYVPYGTNPENTPRSLLIIPLPDSMNEEGAYTEFYIWDPWHWDTNGVENGTGAMQYVENPIAAIEEYLNDQTGLHPFDLAEIIQGSYYRAVGTVDTEANSASFENLYPYYSMDALEELQEFFANYYGRMDLYIATTSSLEEFSYKGYVKDPEGWASVESPAPEDLNFSGAQSTVQPYAVYMANNPEYKIVTESITNAQGLTDGENNDYKLDYQSGSRPARNLDNVAVTVQITNERDQSAALGEGFGLELLDYSYGNGAFKLYYTGSAYPGSSKPSSIPVAVWNLLKTADGRQTIVFEPGLCTENGWYTLWLETEDTSNGLILEQKLGQFFMDSTVLDVTAVSAQKGYSIGDTDSYQWNAEALEQILAEEGEFRLGLAPAPEGWTQETATITFTNTTRPSDDPADPREMAQLRVYNQTYNVQKGLALDAGEWRTVSPAWDSDFTYDLYPADLTEQTPYVLTDAEGNAAYRMPMVAGRNLIVYEIQSTNGVITTHEMMIDVSVEAEPWELVYEVTCAEGTDKALSAEVWPVGPQGEALALNESNTFDRNRYHFRETESRDGHVSSYTYDADVEDVEYFLVDLYGNISTKNLTITDDAGNVRTIDSRAPYWVGFTYDTGSPDYAWILDHDQNGDTFYFVVEAYDGESRIDPRDVTLTFDEEYSKVLPCVGGTIGEDGRFTMPLPLALDENGELLKNEDGTYAVWQSYDTTHNGIFKTQVLDTESDENPGHVSIAVMGTWKYDETLTTTERTLTVSVPDAHKNIESGDLTWNAYHDPYSLQVYAGDQDYGYDMLTADGVVGVLSDVPFASIEGYGAGEMRQIIGDWSGFRDYYTEAPMITEDTPIIGEDEYGDPIYEPYQFTVTDLFGQTHTVGLDVTQYGDLGIDVDFSTTEPTNQAVTIYAEATGNIEKITSIVASDGTEGTIDPEDPGKASIVLEENCTVTIQTDAGNERVVRVSNIDKTLGDAYITYYDETYSPLDLTAGASEVTAVLSCDTEYLYTTNGPESYTFPAGSRAGDTYTFEYRDAAGNTGTITAVLPVDLAIPEGPDTEAPDVNVTLYAGMRTGYEFIDRFDNPQYNETAGESELTAQLNDSATGGFRAKTMRLVLNIQDTSAVKVLAVPAGSDAPADYASADQGSTVDGVTLAVSRNTATIDITNNVTFDLYLIDEAGNINANRMIRITSIDDQAPELTPTYAVITDPETGYTVVTATFYPSDEDLFAEITALSADALSRQETVADADGNEVSVTRYYYVFETNGTYSFRYEDDLGNTGTALAEVKGLSNDPARVTATAWYGTKQGAFSNVLPHESDPVNRDVTAQLRMSKPISGVELFVYDEQQPDGIGAPLAADAPVQTASKGFVIDVTYQGNVDDQIVVRFTASGNSRKGTCILPAVTCIDKQMPQVTLRSAELSQDKQSIHFTFDSNEDVLFSQDMAAGYTAAHQWIARDDKPMTLYFTDKAGNQLSYPITDFSGLDLNELQVSFSASADGADPTGQPAIDLALTAGDTLYVYVSKTADANLNGETELGQLAADQWNALVLPDGQGVNILRLTDVNTGDVLAFPVYVKAVDRIAPAITFDQSTVLVDRNAAVEEMLLAIREGVRVTDNVDTGISFDVTGYPESTQAGGLYTLSYTAQDSAGNQVTASRYLYILDENTPILWINGEVGLPYSTVYVGGSDIGLTMQNMDALQEQPLVIKYAEGLLTTGQMKYYGEPVEDMRFQVGQTGHYTIYVRAQDRTEFVTYIYVEG